MIGFFDYTVWLTYLSLCVSVCGITFATKEKTLFAIICLGVSGLLDGVDGRVARTKKNRTEEEKSFGMQIDSLTDLVCFGVLPAVICYSLGVNGPVGICLWVFFVLCGMIRLAYFNVMEPKWRMEEGNKRYFHGMPITTSAMILLLSYLAGQWMPQGVLPVFLHFVMGISGFLFILDFRVPKISNKLLAWSGVVTALIFFALIWMEIKR